MRNAIATMEMISAAIGSLCLAGLFEWFCLLGLMRLMPARTTHQVNPDRPMNPDRVRPGTRKLLQVSRLELHG